ncbi:MAG: cobalamin B12-binding domain-containing protein [Kiloniellaceae bacterium]
MASLSDEGETKGYIGDGKEFPDCSPPPASFCHVAVADGSDERLEQLVRTIEGEIIPRLVLAHRPAAANGVAAGKGINGTAHPSATDVAELTTLVLNREYPEGWQFVCRVMDRGVGQEVIFLDLLAPTAKRLGEFWIEDLCTFTDVTIGLGRLQQILRQLSRNAQIDIGPWEQGRRALLVPAPREQHNFGVLMVAEFLRRAGWDVSAQPVISSKQAVEIVSGEWYAILGLSLSCEDGLDDLALEITDARKQSRNEDLAVIVGGRVFVDHPEYAVQVGADAMAVDGRHAVLQADSLHTLLMARC